MVYKQTGRTRYQHATAVICSPIPSLPFTPLQAAVGWDYQEKLAQHESQTDAKKGFGGRYGVQKDRQDEV